MKIQLPDDEMDTKTLLQSIEAFDKSDLEQQSRNLSKNWKIIGEIAAKLRTRQKELQK